MSFKSNNPLLLTFSAMLATVVILSCRDAHPGNNKPSAADKVNTIAFPLADTVIIDSVAAIFFTADSLHIEKFISQFGETAFDGTDHECFYQMKNAKTSLKEHWQEVHIYEIKTNTVLHFKKNDGSSIFHDLRYKNDLCGLYLFNGKKDPLLADMMGIGTSLESYFLK